MSSRIDAVELRAASGLRLALAAEGPAAVGLGDAAPDWLGPLQLGLREQDGYRPLALRPAPALAGRDALGAFEGVQLETPELAWPLRASLRAYRDRALVVFRLEAAGQVAGLATGRFAEPALAWPWLRPAARRAGGAPDGLRSAGYQSTEFAFPVMGDGACGGMVFVPHRPAVVLPLLFTAPDGRTLLLAPLEGFHEQIIAVPRGPDAPAHGLLCGWHGDLDQAPAGFATELGLFAADTPGAALEAFGAELRARHGTVRRGRYGDALMGRLSYWTDNGGVYYYRTAPGLDYTTTLERVVEDLSLRDIPVHAVHVDSWFYPHVHLRPVSEEGAPVVPPSGMMSWEPREDVFPEGLEGLSQRLGSRPLSFHSRHFSARSPYFEAHEAFVDGEQAHPVEPAFFHLLLERAARWGAVTYEQDWMVESFFGVRGLREAPGRTGAWQRALDDAAAERGLSLLWCMSTPADFLESTRLRQISAIRTSGDYQYLYDNALNWVWFLHTNRLARALGLWPFKDVFLSHDKTPEGFGEPYAEAESLLAALSGGPVGIGDQIGHARPEIVMRTCREDGVLVKPDLPIAALDRCVRAHGYFAEEPLLAETVSRHPAGTWVYLVAMNASHATKRGAQRLALELPLSDLGTACPVGPVLAYDWRRREFQRLEPGDALTGSLAYQDFSYNVLCPLLPGGIAVFGDVTRYATVGDRRVAHIRAVPGGVAFDVLGPPGAQVEVHGFAGAPATAALAWSPAGEVASELETGSGGRWLVRVRFGASGQARVTVHVR
jgi:hypothetical protein